MLAASLILVISQGSIPVPQCSRITVDEIATLGICSKLIFRVVKIISSLSTHTTYFHHSLLTNQVEIQKHVQREAIFLFKSLLKYLVTIKWFRTTLYPLQMSVRLYIHLTSSQVYAIGLIYQTLIKNCLYLIFCH